MSMVERVAKEIEIAFVEKTAHHPIAKLLPRMGWIWPILARAALAAMREPTEAMIKASSPFACDYHMADEVWEAMIDAALAEK
jgi:hypothetical protein